MGVHMWVFKVPRRFWQEFSRLCFLGGWAVVWQGQAVTVADGGVFKVA